ncbi:MAG: hypothetical protein DCC88_11140 [Spirobacillus cienkowskii]|jgi:bifunctional UDP-N-acetylglucosamine pyrophosphorylase/glucosamine-1-phosphate N-acetyltransferase|uniref:Nucleotidyl transferase domain-containing protein n=1 Tax=Spirobacillus cienkowskii TaxID=495820 RepID=A0A369KKS4_9BACT|nr:MAG: hypothetical protein DCC88_11140 [Spirobacillus cienkowskii]
MKDDFVEIQKILKEKTIGVVLAAGMGKRMKSDIPKVAHVLYGKPLLIWAMHALIDTGIDKIVIVIAPTQTVVEELIKNHQFPSHITIKLAYQDMPLGTGHAARCGIEAVSKYFVQEADLETNILIAYGDTPAVSSVTFQEFIYFHLQQKNYFTILAFKTKNPFGYGRIITDKNGNFLEICEEKDCTEEQKTILLCNSGFLCGNYFQFQKILPQLKNENASKEYYLTDVPILASKLDGKVGYLISKNEEELLGINSQEQLKEMELKFQKKFLNAK